MRYTLINLSLLFFIMLFSSSGKAGIKAGEAAPDFELFDQYNKPHKLSDYNGKWVVLYFYPKDDTPGCTTEACNFRDDIFRIRKLNAEVLGVSVDNTESHAKFSGKHGLPFPLLSDGDAKVARSYDALWSLGPIKVAKRHTFIINPEGKIAKFYRDVNPENHSSEIIRVLETLQK
ncbi:MAG: peroxiredoxin [Gammaproteobacteria bacterium RIFCSPLOWO2_01_FULL_47_190]|nr:MAG: peroxiredoxin [Gammaproteobacteria bacterium RIFCSPLOWO2_01_FULL_47_190]OGT76294.1 MAG: peroxiredoxin [Gammaproteobacteria bacterium RIFCSPLOWO2_12_47_11]OGT88022.1 MAG: peroxiredoxin [Gammaproteobacteria bacterium RIFCSPLOWO2_12_FULL_47_76]